MAQHMAHLDSKGLDMAAATAKKRRAYGAGSVYPTPDGGFMGSIEAGYTKTGNRRRIRVTGKTEAEVKRKLRDRQREIDQHGVSEQSNRVTVKAWSDLWLAEQQRTLRPKTYAGYASAVKQWIVPAIGKKRLDELSASDVRAVANAVRTAPATATKAAGRSGSTVHHAHVVLAKMLKDARAESHRVPDSVFAVRPPSRSKSDRGAIPNSDARALLEVAAGDRDGSRWVAALLQGMRQGECLGLTWDCVDLDAGLMDISWQLQALPRVDRFSRTSTLRVPDGYEYRQLYGALCLVRPKTAQGQRIIPLVPWMTTALAAWKAVSDGLSPHGLVWPRGDGQPLASSVDRAGWNDLQQRAGVAKDDGELFELHEARHTTATLLMEAGVNPAVVIAILGHSTIATSRGYMHADQQHARAAMEQVAQRLALVGS